MSVDTSAEAVERLAAFHALSVDRYDADEDSGLRACAHMTAATLRALLAENERVRGVHAAAVCEMQQQLKRALRAEAERDAARALNDAMSDRCTFYATERDAAKAALRGLIAAVEDAEFDHNACIAEGAMQVARAELGGTDHA